MNRSAAILRIFFLAVPTCAFGCTGDGGSVAPPAPASVLVEGYEGPLHTIGERVQLSARLLDESGAVMTGQSFTWSTTDGTVVAVDNFGLVTVVGAGTARVEARASGVTGSVEVSVEFVATAIIARSGVGQTALVGQALASPLSVEVQDATGSPLVGHEVRFEVVSGAGSLSVETPVTDLSGLASTVWTLGTSSSVAHTLTARAGAQVVEFAATALPDVPASFAAEAGEGQIGPAGETLPSPLVVGLRDRFGNGVPDIEVLWTVDPESGVLSGAQTRTDVQGQAVVAWTLEAHAGSKEAVAEAEGFAPVAFRATATPNGVIEGTVRVAGPDTGLRAGAKEAAEGSKRSTAIAAMDHLAGSSSSSSVRYVPGELLVRMRRSFAAAADGQGAIVRDLRAADLRARTLRAQVLAAEDRILEPIGVIPVLNTLKVRVPTDLDLSEAESLLLEDPRVESVSRNWLYRRHAETYPSPEPLYPRQAWHLETLELSQAWKITRGDPNVIVAILDTGVRFDHPDVAENLTSDGFDFVSASFSTSCDGEEIDIAGDGDGRDEDPTDPASWLYNPSEACPEGIEAEGSHGLHVTGTVVAADDNGGGVGVAPQARVRPVRVLGVTGGAPSDDLANGILYAAGLPADGGELGPVQTSSAQVISMSWGAPLPDPLLESAIQAAHAEGLLLIASAGNGNSTAVQYPSAYEEVVAVSAVSARGIRSSYSNRGAHIEIAGPGGELSLGRSHGVTSTTWRFSGDTPSHASWHGTSMAAPHVAGVAALLFAQNPARSGEDVRAILRTWATDAGPVGRDDRYGYGVVNAYDALTEGQGLPGDVWVELRDADTGEVVAVERAGESGAFRFEGLPDGRYALFGGRDEFGDGSIGQPPRRWGTLGGVDAPATLEFDGAAVRDGSFFIGFPGEVEPNDSPQEAAPLPLGGYLNAALDNGGDADVFRIEVGLPGRYEFETRGWLGACGFAEGADTVMELLDASEASLALNDDVDTEGDNLCSKVVSDLAPGTYYLRVTPWDSRSSAAGAYRILARPLFP